MEPQSDRTPFPAIDTAYRFRPPFSQFTYMPEVSMATTTVEPSSVNVIPSPNTLITSTVGSSMPETDLPPATSTPSPTSIPQELSGVSRGAKIGIVLGITVTVVLTVIALALGCLDYRRRRKRRREEKKRRNSSRTRDESELTEWERSLKKSGMGAPGERQTREWEWLPAYMPRERASVSMNVPSMPTNAPTKPLTTSSVGSSSKV